MKVVVNRCYGGFNLSTAAIERCIELGMKLTKYIEGRYEDDSANFVECERDEKRANDWLAEQLERGKEPTDQDIEDSHYVFGIKYHIVNDGPEFRCHPTVVQVVEEMKEAANGRFAELEIIEIPFSDTRGWEIDEYDGMERVVEKHRSW